MSAVVPWWRRVPWTDWVGVAGLPAVSVWLVWAKRTGQHRWQVVAAGTLLTILVVWVAAAVRDVFRYRRRRAEMRLRQDGRRREDPDRDV